MMLSRDAENMYWFARYLERAENTARFVAVNANLVLDLPRSYTFGWEPLIAITGTEALFREHYRDMDERSVVRFLLGDPHYGGSVISSLARARENLRTARDIVPREAWELINDLYLQARENLSSGVSRRHRYTYLSSIIDGSQRMAGLLSGTMSHDEAYEFLLLGRNLERADMTTRILDVRSEDLLAERPEELTPFDNIQWMSVLKSLTAYQMYRRHVRTRVRGVDVLRFLLQDEPFPRSVLHCLGEVERGLHHLPRCEDPLRTVTRVKRSIQQGDVIALAAAGAELHEYIDELQRQIGLCHDSIASTYFVLDPATRHDAPADHATRS